MKEKPSFNRVPESKIRELTTMIENGQHGILAKFLNNLPTASDRIAVLQMIEWTNEQNRIRSGKPPRLAFVKHSYEDSDFVDVALLKKSNDWLFQDDVLYRESLAVNVPHPSAPNIPIRLS